VVPSLKKVNPVFCHPVYEPVLLCDSPRPATFQQVTKRLRLSCALKRIAQNCLDEIEDSERRVPVGFDPVLKIFAELFLKYGGTRDVMGHRGSFA
jgi:hypothetical protein